MIKEEEALKKRIIEALHASPIGGYSGIVNTYHWVKQLFRWPGLKKDVMEFVVRCDTCRRCKPENVVTPGLLQPLNIPGVHGKISQWTL